MEIISHIDISIVTNLSNFMELFWGKTEILEQDSGLPKKLPEYRSDHHGNCVLNNGMKGLTNFVKGRRLSLSGDRPRQDAIYDWPEENRITIIGEGMCFK